MQEADTREEGGRGQFRASLLLYDKLAVLRAETNIHLY
jgi:hypothetical protein